MNKRIGFIALTVFFVLSSIVLPVWSSVGTPKVKPTPTPKAKVYMSGSRWRTSNTVEGYMTKYTCGKATLKRWKTALEKGEVTRQEYDDFVAYQKAMEEWGPAGSVLDNAISTKHIHNNVDVVDKDGNIIVTLTTQLILGCNPRKVRTWGNEQVKNTDFDYRKGCTYTTDINKTYVDQYRGITYTLSGFRYIGQTNCNNPIFSSGTLTVNGVEYEVCGFASVTPLIIDLDRNGSPDVDRKEWRPHSERFNAAKAKMFDMDGDGDKNLVEWIGPNDGILVAPTEKLDVNDGREVFGTCFGFIDGYHKLAVMFDKNFDGVVKGEELEGIMVWIDSNQNAVCEKAELVNVKDLGITEISVNHDDYKSDCVINGKKVTTWDWWPTMLVTKPVGRK